MCWQNFPGTLSSPCLLPGPPLPFAFASTVPYLNFTSHFASNFISSYHSTSHSLKLVLILWQLLSPCSCNKLTFLKHLVTAISLLRIVTTGQGHQLSSTSSFFVSFAIVLTLLTIVSLAFSSSAVTLAIPAASWLNQLLCPYLLPSPRRKASVLVLLLCKWPFHPKCP